MIKIFLYLKVFMPYSCWIATLNMVAHFRFCLRRWDGFQSWIWNREDGILNKEVCQRLIEKEIFPLFEIAAQGAPQLYGIDRLFTLFTIHTPELKVISKKRLFFKRCQIEEVKQKIFAFLINKMPMKIRQGSYISFKVVSLSELTLLDFAYEKPWAIRPIFKIL